MESLFIAIPYSRPFTGKTVRSLMLTQRPEHTYFQTRFNEPIDIARNALAQEFLLETKADYLLFVDNDATFHPEAILRLLAHRLPMVSGCMYTRTIPPKPTMARYMGRASNGKDYYKFMDTVKAIVYHANKHQVERVSENDYLFPPTKQDLYAVDAVGMHFTLIRRDVLQAVDMPHFIMRGSTGAGEDFYFCKRVREAGFPIYVDLSIHTGHCTGEENDFGLRELLQFMQFVDPEQLKEEPQAWEIG